MPLSWNEIRGRSVAFVREWESETSESAEAKSFWDGFFHVFGISRRRVAAFEQHVKKADGNDGFIDLFWPGVLLAEHKSRGKNLDSAFVQATDYFPGLKDKELPRYIIVSDFNKFRLFNLDTSEEVEFLLEELPEYLSLFGFIAGYEVREYKEQDPVNIKAAQKLAGLHDALKEVGYEGHPLEVYLVRVLFCLFAEDTGIFMPRSAFEDFIRSRTADDGSDLAPRLNQLFQTLNTPEDKRLKNLDEQIASFPYINGNLFDEFLPQASFDSSMRELLLECCEMDWGSISPAIFGSLFQGIMDPVLRRNLGAHYTSENNILKVINPLFMDELRKEFKKVKSQTGKLKAFHEKLGELNLFDPACGCGNFLVTSYRELRLLELDVIKLLYEENNQQLSIDAVDQYVKIDVDNFHGIEIEEWPAQIAQVAMWLIDHQMNVLVGATFGQTLVRIPLVKSANIIHGNSLTLDWESIVPSTSCSYLIGNPPFSGAMVMDDQARVDRQNVLSEIPGSGVLDFVSCWYWLAAKYIHNTNVKAALVSTNSITQGEQVNLLWKPIIEKYGVRIQFAHRTFKWKNEAPGVAAVHCVIIGFLCGDSDTSLLFDYQEVSKEPLVTKADNINPYLLDSPTFFLSNRSSPICDVPAMRFGSMPRDGGNLILTDDEKNDLVRLEPNSEKWLKRYTGAREFLNGGMRWCLWLKDASPKELRSLPNVLARVDATRQFRLSSKAKATQKYAATPALFCQIAQPDTDYLLVPSVSSQRRSIVPIGFISTDTIASNLVFVVPDATPFHFGIMSSLMHMAWMRTVCGRLKSDYRYSKDIVYNNFPWPVDAKKNQVQKIITAAENIINMRDGFSNETLADLYDPLSMPKELANAHITLDSAVDAAYLSSGGKRSWSTEAERMSFLFKLHNQIVAS